MKYTQYLTTLKEQLNELGYSISYISTTPDGVPKVYTIHLTSGQPIMYDLATGTVTATKEVEDGLLKL